MNAVLPVDTLKLIQETAQRAQEVKIVALPNDPERSVVIGSGTHQIIETQFQEKPRKHIVESIEDFAAAYQRWYLDCEDIARTIATPDGADESEAATMVEQIRTPNIWLDLDKWRLMFFIDEPLRRSWVKLKLTPSPQWQTLCKFRDAQTLPQESLVRLLRHDLARCVDSSALLAFRSISFEKMQNARRQIENQRQSMDADIVHQVGGERKPDEIFATVPALASRELEPFRVRVELSIDIDVQQEKFKLQVLPGDLDLGLEQIRSEIRQRLEIDLRALGLEGVTILCGNPGKSTDSDEL